MTASIIHGDCIEVMAKMEPESVDAIVCDPPYGLEFMGREWDSLGPKTDRRQPGDDNYPAARPTPFGRTPVRYGHGASYGADSSSQVAQQWWHYQWAVEAFRVLKPGGHLLAFGGTRTSHRLACAIEDAGFEIRDFIEWIYGSGFPKSKNIALAIDKGEGHPNRGRAIPTASTYRASDVEQKNKLTSNPVPEYEAKSAAAVEWEGWGTALKPAHEPIIMARKPLIGTVAKNVLEYGTGALNIDGCRVSTIGETIHTPQSDPAKREGVVGTDLGITRADADKFQESQRASIERTNTLGRWPANVILSHAEGCRQVGKATVPGRTINRWDDGAKPFGGGAGSPFTGEDFPDDQIPVYECVDGCPVAELDRQSGERTSGTGAIKKTSSADGRGNAGAAYGAESRAAGTPMVSYGDTGGASRYFQQIEQSIEDDPGFLYCAKAAKKERNEGLSAPARTTDDGRKTPIDNPFLRGATERKNHHPTVKPVALMRHLCRLVTPPGGTVLDPFLGSGTTGVAAIREGFDFIGIEREEEYIPIAEARIEFAEKQQIESDSGQLAFL